MPTQGRSALCERPTSRRPLQQRYRDCCRRLLGFFRTGTAPNHRRERQPVFFGHLLTGSENLVCTLAVTAGCLITAEGDFFPVVVNRGRAGNHKAARRCRIAVPHRRPTHGRPIRPRRPIPILGSPVAWVMHLSRLDNDQRWLADPCLSWCFRSLAFECVLGSQVIEQPSLAKVGRATIRETSDFHCRKYPASSAAQAGLTRPQRLEVHIDHDATDCDANLSSCD